MLANGLCPGYSSFLLEYKSGKKEGRTEGRKEGGKWFFFSASTEGCSKIIIIKKYWSYITLVESSITFKEGISENGSLNVGMDHQAINRINPNENYDV